MLVEAENHLYSVVWRYEYPNGIRKTTCIIKDGVGKDVPRVAEASATLNHADIDCKNCARKVTLNRVLNIAQFGKETKNLFWQAYRQMRGRW